MMVSSEFDIVWKEAAVCHIMCFDLFGSRGRSKGGVCHGSCGYLPATHSRNLGSVQVSVYRIWANTGTGLTSSILKFPHLYHSVIALYSFSHLSPSFMTLATDGIVK